jgi:hypothetical protein
MPLETGKSITPATQKAPSVQDYRQRTNRQVEHANGELVGMFFGWRGERSREVGRGRDRVRKIQSGRIEGKEGRAKGPKTK